VAHTDSPQRSDQRRHQQAQHYRDYQWYQDVPTEVKQGQNDARSDEAGATIA
jgi:hypothetical protein